MTKRNEEWSTREICFVFTYCIPFYALGVLLLYFKVLFGFSFILVSTLFFIPALIEARKKIRRYLKKRRTDKLRKNQKTVIVGGTPQEHHKKKKREPDVFDYYVPVIDDVTSKGKMMEELGLWYEKPVKRFSFEEKEEEVVTPQNRERANKLDAIFEYLEAFGKVRFSYQSHVGDLRGKSIGRFVKTEAKRRGLDVTVKDKGKDVIITMERSPKRIVY